MKKLCVDNIGLLFWPTLYIYIYIIHLATLHNVGFITKLNFAIFAAFKESMTLNIAQRSFKVIHFGGNPKPVYDFIGYRPLIVHKVKKS